MADGLPESACSSVSLAPQGKVLTRHLKSGSVSELDGYTITVIPAPSAGIGRVYQSPGGQLWAVVAEGLQEFKHGEWILHPVPEIAADFRARLPRAIDPIPLCPARQGVVIFLLPDRLLQFNAEDPDNPRTEVLLTAAQTRLERFSNMTLSHDSGLWIAGARGLVKVPGPARNLRPGTDWHDYIPPEPLSVHNLQDPHEEEEGIVTAMAEAGKDHQKLLVRFDGQHWGAEIIPVEKARHAWCGPDKTCWAVTIDSLFAWQEGGREVVENNESSVRQYYDVAVEPGGAFWLATSDGLIRARPSHLEKPPFCPQAQLPNPRIDGRRGWPALVRLAHGPAHAPEWSPRGISIAGFALEQPPSRARLISFEEWNVVAPSRRAEPAVSSGERYVQRGAR